MVRKRKTKPVRRRRSAGLKSGVVGDLIRLRREGLQLTRKGLAENIRISERALAAIELGKAQDMRASTLERLADALEISTDELLGRTA